MKKKVAALVLTLSIVSMLLLLTACGDEATDKGEKIPTPPPVETVQPVPPIIPSPEPPDPEVEPQMPEPQMQTPLSYEDAVAICAVWLDEHDGLRTYLISDMSEPGYPVPPTFSIFGENYYEVHVTYTITGTHIYSLVILVHEETGELISLTSEANDDQSFTYTMKPLDDWRIDESVELTPALLTEDEAFEIYNARVNDLPDDLIYFAETRMNSQSYIRFLVLFGEKYYLFVAEEDSMYWFNILVHADTGDLFFMYQSDGMYPETVIEPLEDVFDRW